MSYRRICSQNVAARCSLRRTYLWLSSHALSTLPATQTRAVCLFWPALHLRMGIPPPPAYSKTSFWVCPLRFPMPHQLLSLRKHPASTHTRCSIFCVSLSSYCSTSLILLKQNFSRELSILLVPTSSPTVVTKLTPIKFYTPNLPISLTNMWAPIVCPTLF